MVTSWSCCRVLDVAMRCGSNGCSNGAGIDRAACVSWSSRLKLLEADVDSAFAGLSGNYDFEPVLFELNLAGNVLASGRCVVCCALKVIWLSGEAGFKGRKEMLPKLPRPIIPCCQGLVVGRAEIEGKAHFFPNLPGFLKLPIWEGDLK